ncbi:2-amino-4-hydroxy-6-hydroxymethyldihydropteridine diphosphokinase [Pseudobacteriovorax antillogorgiicola]|uniref:2-amino-4-hydroxy-6-hydroxymethyldihydropteridine pyrophosphokinase n=1 Tax=Pseudobacteriovorax antillogorgiicola TaxID=1513793 RepID=A0A1Y6BQ32_9BACT|nr:2-amino-4-hydroxy-6-hydroxymethyldihydropteridine diphosphokinase [Pseudobacteriovorax antillogorgiicola]TCS53856.1 2-amino-4-hydroxy-6-hydroxymethyldihydropteridine diphosphokinase [Pseudobacteriovorax antillogorgiicola]SMF21494.1 2-amino-4-hydroxy-6-hydroxymethyldihydropteridinediphosphokinase [Pseudobacteriovorax antillogorgiicola]
MLYRYLIAFGSNIEPRLTHIESGLQNLQEHGQLISLSSIYHTKPVGPANQAFLNGALILDSTLEPALMMEVLLAIEAKAGRVRLKRWDNRTLDLDIILILDEKNQAVVSATEHLNVPHPYMAERDFVLVPCAEIAGDWTYQNTNLKSLADSCPKDNLLKKESSAKNAKTRLSQRGKA